MRNVTFPDLDLDEGDIGGTLSWVMVTEASSVTNYVVYRTIDAMGSNRTLFANVSTDISNFTVSVDTILTPYSHIAVFTMTSLVEQTTPIAHFIRDFAGSASNVIFHDEDMDLGELGGTVNWNPLATEMLVSSYRVYFATDALTKTGVQLVGH